MAIVNRNESSAVERNQRNAVSSVFEKDGHVTILLEMPGVKTDNLDLRIEESKLIIHGEPIRFEEGTFLMRERRTGAYHMTFTVDETIDRNKVEARFTNGILRVELERKEAEKPRSIKVKAG